MKSPNIFTILVLLITSLSCTTVTNVLETNPVIEQEENQTQASTIEEEPDINDLLSPYRVMENPDEYDLSSSMMDLMEFLARTDGYLVDSSAREMTFLGSVDEPSFWPDYVINSYLIEGILGKAWKITDTGLLDPIKLPTNIAPENGVGNIIEVSLNPAYIVLDEHNQIGYAAHPENENTILVLDFANFPEQEITYQELPIKGEILPTNSVFSEISQLFLYNRCGSFNEGLWCVDPPFISKIDTKNGLVTNFQIDDDEFIRIFSEGYYVILDGGFYFEGGELHTVLRHEDEHTFTDKVFIFDLGNFPNESSDDGPIPIQVDDSYENWEDFKNDDRYIHVWYSYLPADGKGLAYPLCVDYSGGGAITSDDFLFQHSGGDTVILIQAQFLSEDEQDYLVLVEPVPVPGGTLEFVIKEYYKLPDSYGCSFNLFDDANIVYVFSQTENSVLRYSDSNEE